MAKRLNTQEKEQAKVGLASGKSINQVARDLHRSSSTISLLAQEPANREQIEALRSEIASDFEGLAKRALVISDKDLAKESAYRKTLIAKIASDSSNILRGLDRSEKFAPKIVINISSDPRQGHEGSIETTYADVNENLDD
jgi:hypothetical protein